MPRRRGGKKISFVHWTIFSKSFLAFGAGTVAATALAAQHEPETLLRIRGNLFAGADGNPVTGAFALIAVGLVLVPEGTGTTVLWSPFADGDAPWIWTESFAVGYEEMVTDVIDTPGLSSVRKAIDSKSMRIIRNQEVQLVAENVTLGGALTMNVNVSGRVLSGT